MMILILTAIFNLWGFIAGLVITALLISFNKTVSGRCYLYPLIPFNGRALTSLLLRKPITKAKLTKSFPLKIISAHICNGLTLLI